MFAPSPPTSMFELECMLGWLDFVLIFQCNFNRSFRKGAGPCKVETWHSFMEGG